MYRHMWTHNDTLITPSVCACRHVCVYKYSWCEKTWMHPSSKLLQAAQAGFVNEIYKQRNIQEVVLPTKLKTNHHPSSWAKLRTDVWPGLGPAQVGGKWEHPHPRRMAISTGWSSKPRAPLNVRVAHPIHDWLIPILLQSRKMLGQR